MTTNNSSLSTTMKLAEDGLRIHEQRMMVAMGNLQKKDITASTPGGDPPRPQHLSFKQEYDRSTGAMTTKIDRVYDSPAPFEERYEPGHPAADPETGIVKLPPVNVFVEEQNIRDAQRAIKSITSAFVTTRNMQRDKNSIVGR